MSKESKEEVNRIKAHLGRHEKQKRQVFGQAVVRLPWYSIQRFRNMVILAAMISCMVMSKPLYDFYWGIRRGIRFEREKTKFIQELDSEQKSE